MLNTRILFFIATFIILINKKITIAVTDNSEVKYGKVSGVSDKKLSDAATFIIEVNDAHAASKGKRAIKNSETFIASIIKNTRIKPAHPVGVEMNSLDNENRFKYNKIMEINFPSDNKYTELGVMGGSNNLMRTHKKRSANFNERSNEKTVVKANMEPILENLVNCLEGRSYNVSGAYESNVVDFHGQCNESKLLEALANVIGSALSLAFSPLNNHNLTQQENLIATAQPISPVIASEKPENTSWTLDEVLKDVLQQLEKAKEFPPSSKGDAKPAGKQEYFIEITKLLTDDKKMNDSPPKKSTNVDVQQPMQNLSFQKKKKE